MLVKLSSEMLAAIGGASNAAEASDRLAAFFKTAKDNANFMAESKVTLESLQANITALEGKILTEAKVKEICGASATESITDWAASDAGKKIIGGEASRIAMEALANVGTQPAKPAPASAGGESPEQKSSALIAQGKFEEAYAADEKIRAEFPSAKHFAAFGRNAGAVKISQKN